MVNGSFSRFGRSADEAVAAGQPDLSGMDRARERGTRQHEAFLNAVRAQQVRSAPESSVSPAPVGMSADGDYQGYALRKLRQMGINDASQWNALRQLWQKESGWNPNAVNRSSGAFGIAQILPSAHPTANRNMSAQEQIDWGLNYIMNRYGNPLAAWQHSQRTNWY